MLPPNLSFLLNQSSNALKKKIFQGGKPVIFGLKPKEEDLSNTNNNIININNNPTLLHANSGFLTTEGNFEKENSAINFNSIFNSVPGKNPIFISNTHLPNTNLFKSVQVPQDSKTSVNANSNANNAANNSFDSGSNLNSQQEKHSNSAEKGHGMQSASGNVNANNDKKFFFMVKK